MSEAFEIDPSTPPRTRGELHAFVRRAFGVTLAREALLAGHQAPFGYVAHAYFEGRGSFAPELEPPTGFDRAFQRENGPIDSVVWANRGGGKTFLGAVATALDLIFKPGIEIRVLGGSLEQSRRMHEHLRALFEREHLAPLVDGRITEKRLRLTTGGRAEILAQSQASVRGTRVQKLRCDEVELFDPLVWEAAQLVTRSRDIPTPDGLGVRGSVECLSTMHIPHGLMFDLVKACAEGRRTLFKWGVVDVLGACDDRERACRGDGDLEGDCPLLGECAGRAKARDGAGAPAGHVSVRDAIDMKARVGLPVWEAEMLCLRPTRTHAVLPEFDPRVHVIDSLPPGREQWAWIGGMDFGYRGATVVLWACVRPGDGAIFVAFERVETEVVLGEHVAAIVGSGMPTLAWLGVDPAGRQRNDQTGLSPVQVLTRAGLRVRSRKIGLHEGIQLLRGRLKPASGEPRLFVHRRCARLIECLERYHYPADRPHELKPEKDGHDHAVDALRYMVQNAEAQGARAGSYL